MRKSILALGSVVAIAGIVTLSSGCNSTVKGCMSPNDDNYNSAATEDDGTCDETATVAKFLGTYSVSETCGGSTSTFDVTITESSTTDYGILISNFADVFQANVSATVTQDDFAIANQEPDNDDFTVEGTGTVNGNNLTMSYTVTNNLGQTSTCNCTATKQ